MQTETAKTLPERELNELLRRVDWRFLSGQREAPLIADLTGGRDSRAIELIGGDARPALGSADLVAIDFPTRRSLAAARAAVRPGGEIVCLWRAPRPAGHRRAARHLRRAGLSDIRVLWPGPMPGRPPQFWLPFETPAARVHLLAGRPADSAVRRLLRALWRAAAWAGLLAPLCAIARLPAECADGEPRDEIEAVLPAGAAPLLLTGGGRSINKVVALPFTNTGEKPAAVVKFARVAAADEALEREAAVLRRIEHERPGVSGVPQLLATGRRSGRLAVVESAIYGQPLIEQLTLDRFAELGQRVSDWLGGLAGERRPSTSDWRERLVEAPLRRFEHEFGAAAPLVPQRCREILAGLGDLPAACEHRDCSPWNVVVADGALGLLDWESAEPDGLPGLDLVYFLANAAFVLDRVLENGPLRPTYAQLLDATSAVGRVFAICTDGYRSRLGIEFADFRRLRLLCWIVHSHSEYRHLEMAAVSAPSPEVLRSSMFLGLVEEELAQNRPTGRAWADL